MKNAGRAILLTAQGSAAIATVRLVGPGVDSFLRRHFSSVVTPERCVHGILRDGNRVIDDPVIVLHENSWTADLNLHGGPWVIRSMLNLALADGFEVIESAGLPLIDDAVDASGDIEREIVAHLPKARTELGIRLLLAQRQAWKGLPDIDPSQKPAIVRDRTLHWLLNPPTVAIIGLPNVGKSTLANQLFGTNRSIVADTSGTTRDWVGELASINGLPVFLVDTPGRRMTDNPIEAAAIDHSLAKVSAADWVIVVIDLSEGRDAQESLLMDYPDALVVANKADRTGRWSINNRGALHTVATSGEGIEQLRDAIRSRFLTDPDDFGPMRCWTDRQRDTLQQST